MWWWAWSSPSPGGDGTSDVEEWSGAGFVHPPASAHRVLDARRRGADRRRRGGRGRRRAARDRHHRPREHVRRPRLLQGRQEPGRQADHRHRALPGLRAPHRAPGPPRPHGRLRRRGRGRRARPTTTSPLLAENATRLQEPHPALEPGVPRGLLHEAQGRLGAARATTTRASSPPPAASAGTCCRRSCRATSRARSRRRPGSRTSSAGTTSSSRSRTTASPSSARTNPQLLEIARKIGAPLLATNDSHYTHQHDAVAHDALLCVQTGSLMSDPDRFKFHGDEHYLKTAAEMRYAVLARCPRRATTRCGSPSAATSRSSSASRSCRTSRCPRASPTTPSTCEHLTFEGAQERWGDQLPDARASSAWPTSSRSSPTWASARTSSSCGTSSSTPATPTSASGPGRGSAAGCAVAYMPAHHRPRPHQVRPAVRALPQPEPHLDARHRHGLRLPLPRTR